MMLYNLGFIFTGNYNTTQNTKTCKYAYVFWIPKRRHLGSETCRNFI